MRRLTVALSTIIIGVAVGIVPSPASAATGEFGNGCTATTGPSNTTAVMTGAGAGNPLPIAAPSTGIITKARLALPTIGGTIPINLKVMRHGAAANQYAVLAESASINVGSGAQTYDVRVPVTAGDLLGMSGAGALLCGTGDAADTIATVAGNSAVGSTLTYTPATSLALSMVATVEPDADHDGFGDVTQDKCPQSAAFQTPCPVIILDSFASPSGSSITVVVTANNQTNVKVTGKAEVNGKTIKLTGGTKLATAGSLTKFKVKLPKALKSALAGLPASKRIKVTLTATTTDLVGRVSTDTSNIKLPGTR